MRTLCDLGYFSYLIVGISTLLSLTAITLGVLIIMEWTVGFIKKRGSK